MRAHSKVCLCVCVLLTIKYVFCHKMYWMNQVTCLGLTIFLRIGRIPYWWIPMLRSIQSLIVFTCGNSRPSLFNFCKQSWNLEWQTICEFFGFYIESFHNFHFSCKFKIIPDTNEKKGKLTTKRGRKWNFH